MVIAVNFIAFQLAWLGTVLSAAARQPWLGALLIAAVVALHLVRAERPHVEARLVLLCAALGGIFDSVLVMAGWVAYPAGMIATGAAPYWIVAMWALFATTLNYSMAWLKGRDWLAASFGLVGGPLSYLAGEKLGAITLTEPAAAIAALGLGWAVTLPVLMRAAASLHASGVAGADRGELAAEKC